MVEQAIPMVCEHGVRQLSANCASIRNHGAVAGFYSMFYRWSRTECFTLRKSNVNTYLLSRRPIANFRNADSSRPLHSSKSSRTSAPIKPRRSAPQLLSKDESPIAADLRHIMRRLPHSVVVLTTVSAEKRLGTSSLLDQADRKTYNAVKGNFLRPTKQVTKSKQSSMEEINMEGSREDVSLHTHNSEQEVISGPSPVVVERSTSEGFSQGLPLLDPGSSCSTQNVYKAALKESKEYRGMTLSSFTTVSLQKDPIVSFNIRTPSATLLALAEAGMFLIHILEANEAGASLATQFSRGGGGIDAFNGLDIMRMPLNLIEEGFELDNSITYLPLIQSSGVKQILLCRVVDCGLKQEISRPFLQIDDHNVVFGKVLMIADSDGVRASHGVISLGEEWHGLSYADGQYRTSGSVINVDSSLDEGL